MVTLTFSYNKIGFTKKNKTINSTARDRRDRVLSSGSFNVRFINYGPSLVNIYWKNTEDEYIHVKEIPANTEQTQAIYRGHMWMIGKSEGEAIRQWYPSTTWNLLVLTNSNIGICIEYDVTLLLNFVEQEEY